jgi:hypothetical protein
MYNGRALAYSLALLHSTKFAIALLNEEKLVTLLPCQRRPVSAPVGSLEDATMTSPFFEDFEVSDASPPTRAPFAASHILYFHLLLF